MLLIVDQCEELYTLCRDNDIRQRFLQELFQSCENLKTSQLSFRLVITLRADFLGKALSDPYLSRIIRDSSEEAVQTDSVKLLLGAMTLQELKAVIEKPAQKVGVKIEEGLTERILEAVAHEPGNLPLLEFALTLLWNYQSEKTLTITAYDSIGGVERALACYAESLYNKLTPEEQQRAQHIFVQLVQPGEDTGDTRRAASKNDIGEEDWNFAATTLAASRLIITEGSEKSGEKVSLVHEALIKEWRRLGEWLEGDREFRAWQERLRTAMHQWEQSGHDEGALLRGTLLVEAEQWLEIRQTEINVSEQDYITKSRHHLVQEEERWKRLYEEAEEQRKQTEIKSIEALTQTSRARFLAHYELKALLAGVKAGKSLQDINVPEKLRLQVIFNLRDIVHKIHERNRLEGHDSPLWSICFSPDGCFLASGSEDQTIKLWKVATGQEVMTLHGHSGIVRSVAFNPDGKILASGGTDKKIILWNVENAHEITSIRGHSEGIDSVAFNLDGTLLASGSRDRTIKLWNVAEGCENTTLQEYTGIILSVTFSPDGKMLASGNEDHTIMLWSVKTGETIMTLSKYE